MGQGLHQLGPLPGSAAAQPELRTPTIYFRYRQRPGAARKYQVIWPHMLAADMGTPQLRMVKEFRVN